MRLGLGLTLLGSLVLDACIVDAGGDQRDGGDVQHDTDDVLRDASVDQRDASVDQRDASVDQHDASVDQRDASVDQRDASVDRRDASVDQRDASVDRRDASVDQRDASVDRDAATPPDDLDGAVTDMDASADAGSDATVPDERDAAADCACDTERGACDEGCACDYACAPASCTRFAAAPEYLVTKAAPIITLWDENTGIAIGPPVSPGPRNALELREGRWDYLPTWGFGVFPMNDMAMDSPTTAWGAGNNGMWRFEDRQWTQVVVPGATSMSSVVVASDGTVLATGSGKVFVLAGDDWVDVTPAGLMGTIRSAAVVAGGDAWIATDTQLARREAGTWAVMPNPFPSLRSIELTDANNGWAHGVASPNMYRLSDGVWLTTTAATLDGNVADIDIIESGPAYAATVSGSFYRFSEGSWQRMAVDDGVSDPLAPVCSPWVSGCELPVHQIAAAGSGAIATSGDTSSSPGGIAKAGFWRLEGDTWRLMWPVGVTVADLWGIDFRGDTAFVTGAEDRTWARMSNGVWTLEEPPMSGTGIDASGGPEPWVVGLAGSIAHFDAALDRWEKEPNRVTDYDLSTVAMNADGSGWAAGGVSGSRRAVVLRRVGGTWTKHEFTPSYPLSAIVLDGPDSGWAVGGSQSFRQSVIARLDHGIWTEIPSPTDIPLYALALDANGDGWAVGGAYGPERSVTLRLKDGEWSVVPGVDEAIIAGGGVPAVLVSVAIDRSGYGWAVGWKRAAVALHGDTATACPDAFDPLSQENAVDVTIGPDGRSWVVGLHGFRAHSP